MKKMIVVEEAKDITLLKLNSATNEWLPAGGPDVTSLVNSSFRIGNKIFIRAYVRFRNSIDINAFTSNYRFGFILDKNHIDLSEFNQIATKYPSLMNVQGGQNITIYKSEWTRWENKGSIAIMNNWTDATAGSTKFAYLFIEGIMEDPTWVKGYNYTWSYGNNDAGWEVAGPYFLTNESTGEVIKLAGAQDNFSNDYMQLPSAGKWVMPYTGADYDTWGISFYAYDKDRKELIGAVATYNTANKQYELVIDYSTIDVKKIVNASLLAE